MANAINGFNQVWSPAASGGRNPAAGHANGASWPAATVSKFGGTSSATDAARLLQRLGEAVAGSPVIDVKKVRAVKTAVARRFFTVDAERVADRMLQFDRDLS